MQISTNANKDTTAYAKVFESKLHTVQPLACPGCGGRDDISKQ